MSCNREIAHILVIPEDDANRQMANGLHMLVDPGRQRQLQVLREVGGWRRVLKTFEEEYIVYLTKYPASHVVLLVDFDQQEERFLEAKKCIPQDFADRVFVFGVWDEPEAMKELGTPETVGRLLATDCRDRTDYTWSHSMLKHNVDELSRIRKTVCDVIF
jgi:hypothetical protein